MHEEQIMSQVILIHKDFLVENKDWHKLWIFANIVLVNSK